MPRIPIHQARELRGGPGSPGPQVRPSTAPPDVGGQLLPQAMGQAAQALQQTSEIFFRAEARSNRVAARAKMQTAFAELALDLQNETNHARVADRYRKSADQIRSRMQSEYQGRPGMSDISEDWMALDAENQIRAAQQQRKLFIDQATAEYETAIIEAERHGDRTAAEDMINQAVEDGIFTRTQGARKREQIGRNVDFWDAHDAIREDPERLIRNLSDGTYKQLSREDRARLRSQAETQIAHNQRKQDHARKVENTHREAALIETMSAHNYDAAALIDQVTEWENDPDNPLPAKEAAQWRKRIRDGEKDQVSDQWRAQLNHVRARLLADDAGDIDLDSLRAEVIDVLPDVPIQEADRALSLMRKINSARESRATVVERETADLERVAAKQMQKYHKVGMFANRIIDKDGRDITDQERRAELRRMREAPFRVRREGFLWRRPADDETIDQWRRERAAEMREQWEEDDRFYNRYTEAVDHWIARNPQAGEAELKQFMRDMLTEIYSDRAYDDAALSLLIDADSSIHVFGDERDAPHEFYNRDQ